MSVNTFSWADQIEQHFKDHGTNDENCVRCQEPTPNPEPEPEIFVSSKPASKTGSPLFSAKYGGRCQSCGDHFEEYSDIGYVEGRPGPLCSSCHTRLDTFNPWY